MKFLNSKSVFLATAVVLAPVFFYVAFFGDSVEFQEFAADRKRWGVVENVSLPKSAKDNVSESEIGLYYGKKENENGDFQNQTKNESGDKKEKDLTTLPEMVLLDVPFVSQAPFGEWENLFFQDGCEETSALMVARWAMNKTISKEEARKEIVAMSQFELKKYGYFQDSSIKDTAKMIKDYFSYENVEVKSNIGIQDIKIELSKGRLVIVSVNGQKIKNPFYTPPGPERHMLVVKGYDENTREFITNDPGTRRGESFRYSYDTIEKALRDYPSGNHLPIMEEKSAMIVIEK